MDDNYYNFTLKHSSIDDGIHLANIKPYLLESKSLFGFSQSKNEGEQVDKNTSKNTKRRFRLSAM